VLRDKLSECLVRFSCAAVIEEGMSPIEATIKGSNEIFFAVISISITLAAVFLPVIFLEGFVGRLFRIWRRSYRCCGIDFGFCIVDITFTCVKCLMKVANKKNLNSTFELNLIFKN
jgi:Cu/Ag efflux pump CusA